MLCNNTTLCHWIITSPQKIASMWCHITTIK